MSGNIASPSEKDYFCLSATGGQTYQISVDLASLSDSVLEVYSPDGVTKIAENDDGGTGTASYLEWTAPGTGVYRLAVRGYGSDTGSYTITVQSSAAADPCNGSGARLTGSGDVFFSDQYENSASCQWLISCSSGHPSIHFTQFETESNFDFVNVFDGSSTGSTQLAHLSGSSLSQSDYSASSRSMVVQFTADASVAAGGFELSYNCGAHRRLSTGATHTAKVVQHGVYSPTKKGSTGDLTDEEMIARFPSLYALLTALSSPSTESRQEHKGIPHNIWLLFINTLVRKASATPEGSALLAQFQQEEAETAAAAKEFAHAMTGSGR